MGYDSACDNNIRDKQTRLITSPVVHETQRIVKLQNTTDRKHPLFIVNKHAYITQHARY
jgi:hypothetical protein